MSSLLNIIKYANTHAHDKNNNAWVKKGFSSSIVIYKTEYKTALFAHPMQLIYTKNSVLYIQYLLAKQRREKKLYK